MDGRFSVRPAFPFPLTTVLSPLFISDHFGRRDALLHARDAPPQFLLTAASFVLCFNPSLFLAPLLVPPPFSPLYCLRPIPMPHHGDDTSEDR